TNGSSLTLNNCIIGGTSAGQANSGAYVGGVENIGGILTITGGSIVGNTGMGVHNISGTATLNGVTIANNVNNDTRFDEVGGVGLSLGTINILNCLVANNTGQQAGGVLITKIGVAVTIVNTTISGNN